MNNFLKKQILKKRNLIFVFVVLILYIVFNFSLTIVYINVPSNIFFGNNTVKPKFSKNYKNKYFILSKKGRKTIITRHNESMSSKIIHTQPFLIPKTVQLDINKQYQSEKVAFNASECLVYDNAVTNTSIASDCVDEGSQFFMIKNGIPEKSDAFTPYNIHSYGLQKNGLYLETKDYKEENNTLYNILLFNSTSKAFSGPVLSFKSPGRFVTDSKSGLVAGYINGNQFYKLQDGSVVYKLKIEMDNNVYGLATYSGDSLFIFQGNNPSSLETEGSEVSLSKQIIDVYGNSGKSKSMEISADYFILDISVLDNQKLLANTIDQEGVSKIHLIDRSSGNTEVISPVNPDLTIVKLFPFQGSVIFLSNGIIWKYDIETNQFHTLYSSSKTYVKNLIRNGDKLYLSASSSGNEIYNIYTPAYVLDLNNTLNIERSRLEDALPIYNETKKISIDHYRNKILITSVYKNAINQSKDILEKYRVDYKNYSLSLNDSKYQDTW